MEKRMALITGATGDIGIAITKRLCKDGFQPIIVSKTKEKLEAFSNELRREFDTDVLIFPCDVSKSLEVNKFLDDLSKIKCCIHTLVNCAGKSCGGNTVDIDDSDWDDVIATNLNSVFYITKGVLFRDLLMRNGRIVNIASTGGKQGVIHGAPYSASKHGVVGFTKSLGLELARNRSGITVNAVCPGFVESEMAVKVRKNYSKLWNTDLEETKKRVEERIPIGRYIEPCEVADMVSYLVSPSAQGVTAQALNICGGLGNY